MRIVITGGGTGGHIYPALAVADALRADGSHSVLYIGKINSLESELVPSRGFDFESIDFAGMPRKAGPELIQWTKRLWTAVSLAGRHIDQFKPDVVFGTGGYVSAPVLMAAGLRRIPYVIHEPDAHPGLVNRLMSRWAHTVTGAFAASALQMKAKRFQVTGNPVRQDIIAMSRQPQRKHAALHQLAPHWYAEKPVLMVTGGSQGARSINQAMAAIVPELLDTLNILVIHQTGKKLYDETLEALPEAYREHPNYLLRPYFDDMAPLLASADLAVCRSGSLSLSELMVCGIPTILIPYPYAAADHQRKNAEAQVAAGTSRMIADKELTGPVLLNAIRSLINEPEALQRMKAAALKMSHPDATEAIVRVLSGVATERART